MLALLIKRSKQNFGMTACYKYEQPMNRWKCIWAGGEISPSEFSPRSQKSPFISLFHSSLHLCFKTGVWLVNCEVIALYVDVHHVFRSSGPHQVIWDVLRKPLHTCKTKRCWVDQRQDLHINIHNMGWINGLRGLFLSLLSLYHT